MYCFSPAFSSSFPLEFSKLALELDSVIFINQWRALLWLEIKAGRVFLRKLTFSADNLKHYLSPSTVFAVNDISLLSMKFVVDPCLK